MNDKLRTAVIGTGIMGSSHARQFATNAHTTLVAVADTLTERAEALAKELGAKAYSDFREMLSENKLDIVIVATPDPYHREPIEAACQAGVPNIFTEKPLATTVEDGEAIMEAVRKAGARILTNYSNRVNPLDIAAHYFLQNGLVGEVAYGDVRLDDNISVPTNLWGSRSREWAAHSSTAHFLLSHVSDILRWYLAPAEVEAVYAISQRRILGFTPDLYDCYLFFKDAAGGAGAKVHAKAEWAKEMDELVEFYISLTGSKGSIVYNKLPGFGVTQGLRANVAEDLSLAELQQHQEALKAKGLRSRLLRRASRVDVGEGFKPGFELYLAEQKQPFPNLLDYAVEALVEGSDTPKSWAGNGSLPWGDEGLKATKIVAAIIESAEKGKEVEVR